MLLQLNITNFALIEKLQISFDKGFNIFSGETGAGKSILIDAINFVLGGKFNKDLIRTGENKTYVEAVFTLENDKTAEVLKELDIEYEDLIIISRETFQSGKTIAKVNGKSLLLSQIKQLSATLLDIHGQHENQNLLDVSTHLNYLDYYGQNMLKDVLEKYSVNYHKLMEINNRIKELEGIDGESEKLTDFFKYQIDEIENARLGNNEDTELEKKFKMISNAEKINKVLEESYEILYSGSEESKSIYDELGFIIRNLRSIEKNIEAVFQIAKSIEDAYYIIDQNVQEIRNIKEDIYFDQNELNYINERINFINGLKKKYGSTIEEIMNYKKNIQKKYDDFINSKEIIEELKKQYDKISDVIKEQSVELHRLRSEIAEELSKKVKKELNSIGLEKSIFQIEVSSGDVLLPSGSDKVQFLISTNPGEPLKPLEKVVSGGELSRIMLALKTVFVDKDKIPSVIFDEIDVGISGRIAQSVGEKMFLISNKHQVFCVTHLPQIACISDTHFVVSKDVKDEKTYTQIKKLTIEEKEFEIARMIGGAEVTKLTLEHSKELIKMADSKKIEFRDSFTNK